ncbi:hypothetical protein UPYG_G00217510 [Umbra pygmaea]|uniref:Uncharacterized protein n=1 Tax=Umbra pygmaea TaxID=75934 RepID=A0ABD0X555_UMBPY
MPVVSCYRVSLLALLTVAVVVTAAPTQAPTEAATKVDCGQLVKLLPADKLNTVFGEWILIEAYSDNENYVEKFQVIKSSKIELLATSSDNNVLLKQQDMIDDICVRYFNHNMTVIENTLQLTSKTLKLQESELQPIRKQAQCLQFSLPARFTYDGAAEFCADTEGDTYIKPKVV